MYVTCESTQTLHALPGIADYMTSKAVAQQMELRLVNVEIFLQKNDVVFF